MTIDISKQYRTSSGLDVKALRIDPDRTTFCVKGIVLDPSAVGGENRCSWTLDGRYGLGGMDDLDLVEAPELPAEVSSATAISMDKQYRTIEGQKVRIYCIDGNGTFPVHGAVWEEGHNYWVPFKWTAEGNEVFNAPKKTDRYNLVEVKPRIQREYWCNLYRDNAPGFHLTKENADIGAMPSRIACVKVVIDCEEGEGLE